MKLLTKQMQSDMSRQVSLKSRDLDICMFGALEGSLERDFLLDCLMLYQNRDGGFGHGLYIDNYNTNTSVYQIYEAFRLLDMLGFDSTCENELYEDIINHACNYLYNREVPKDGIWNANTKSNNDFAHSFEFEYSDENTKLFGLHPTAAILGYTLVFTKPTKAYYKKAMKMLPSILDSFYKKDSLTRYEFISFNSLLSSLKKTKVLENEWAPMEAHLIELAIKCISLDFDDPQAFRPLDIALELDNEELNAMKDKHLDYLIDSIAPHGMWDKLGGWGYDKYAEEDSAKLKWLGAGTVNNYFLLKKCGRIE